MSPIYITFYVIFYRFKCFIIVAIVIIDVFGFFFSLFVFSFDAYLYCTVVNLGCFYRLGCLVNKGRLEVRYSADFGHKVNARPDKTF